MDYLHTVQILSRNENRIDANKGAVVDMVLYWVKRKFICLALPMILFAMARISMRCVSISNIRYLSVLSPFLIASYSSASSINPSIADISTKKISIMEKSSPLGETHVSANGELSPTSLRSTSSPNGLPDDSMDLYMVIVYVPETHSDIIRDVLMKNKAGTLETDNYDSCSFTMKGM